MKLVSRYKDTVKPVTNQTKLAKVTKQILTQKLLKQREEKEAEKIAHQLMMLTVLFKTLRILDSLKQKIFNSAGGLVTAVAPVVIRGSGIWVGWPGIHLDDPNEKIPESDPDDKTPTAGLLSKKVYI